MGRGGAVEMKRPPHCNVEKYYTDHLDLGLIDFGQFIIGVYLGSQHDFLYSNSKPV